MVDGVNHEAGLGVIWKNNGEKASEDWLNTTDVTDNVEQACGLPRLVVSNSVESEPLNVQAILPQVWFLLFINFNFCNKIFLQVIICVSNSSSEQLDPFHIVVKIIDSDVAVGMLLPPFFKLHCAVVMCLFHDWNTIKNL